MHPRWIRISHWVLAASVAMLAVSGFVILMAHPRLYWGKAGNDLTPALIELPISRNYQHGGWSSATPFFADQTAVLTANRTYEIFNQNGWARSLHFLAAWWFVVPGAIYLLMGWSTGHFRAHVWPRRREVSPGRFAAEIRDHLRFRVPPATGGPAYGLLQKCSYSAIVFVTAPLMVLTGLTMSPTIAAGYPILLSMFGGVQSARTIHFLMFVALVMFVVVHIVMVAASGFWRQLRGMTLGE